MISGVVYYTDIYVYDEGTLTRRRSKDCGDMFDYNATYGAIIIAITSLEIEQHSVFFQGID